ncbi:DNA methyltransferase [Xanthobacter aminoxidans]|uniref:DNA methyltransferase n=1 Tax=Xanthobacter aminoxidans TaxID=186280 RepID=UPI0020230AC2|nr:DNA methyltransferase [Xanthobacter aminoxidans]MCL8385549.1 site-specific DNA-methyltransferase [Xanthobacter aminoxidans]
MTGPETFLGGRVTLHCGDSRDVLRAIPDASIHAVVTDPPYALVSIRKRFGGANAAPAQQGRDGAYARASAGFMGQQWDTGETAFAVEFWAEVLRVLKPGGHVVAFGGTRTDHRLKCAIEDAGFEVRDTLLELMSLDPILRDFVNSLSDAQLGAFMRVMDLMGFEGLRAWVYGTGFPKSHDAAKCIDKALGAAGEVVPAGAPVRRIRPGADQHKDGSWEKLTDRTYQPGAYVPGSAEAEAWQGWGTAVKPAWEPIILARKPLEGSVAANVLAHGTGALNIDGCRIEGESTRRVKRGGANDFPHEDDAWVPRSVEVGSDLGRFPANIVHDGSPEVGEEFPQAPGQSGAVTGDEPSSRHRYILRGLGGDHETRAPRGDSGSAARFFYSAKADADDRLGSKHPTVKPVDLMRWLCRLVTPPGGMVLDPFAGTGTTGEAAWREGFSAVLVEREAEYQADIRRRMALCLAGPAERKRESAKARAANDDPGPLFGAASQQKRAAE